METNNKTNANNGNRENQMSFNALNTFFSVVMSPYKMAQDLQLALDCYSTAVMDGSDLASEYSKNAIAMRQIIALLIATQQENDPSELPSLAEYLSDVSYIR